MNNEKIQIGVIGIGLMGSSIVTSLLISGHPVVAMSPLHDEFILAKKKIANHLESARKLNIIENTPEIYLNNLAITENYLDLKNCKLVIETVIEDFFIKKSIYTEVEKVISPNVILASNTSAIPISLLQKTTLYPNRFLGLHWSEPAYTNRFLEIICGDDSDISNAEYLYQLSHSWSKEPVFVRKDILGFISNRLMYALFREGFSLVKNGYASIEDVDKACRNNLGYFMTFVGMFRWMDLTGIPAYQTVMKDLFPTLDNSSEIPSLISEIVNMGGKGLSNHKGFYNYTEQEAKLWEETFIQFSNDIRQLASKYPTNIVERKLNSNFPNNDV